MKSAAPDFDPRIIEAFAERLYSKASSFLVGSVVVGVVLGMAFGAVPLTSLGESWPIPSMFGFATMLVGAILGGIVGYAVGDTRAFGYKLQAQTALCQLEIERNSAETAYWLQQLAEGAQAPAPAAPAPAARGSEPPLSPPLGGPPVAAAR
jgi:hypothetical protein